LTGTGRIFRRAACTTAVVAALALAGCGVIPRLAHQTTAAAIAPVASTARVVSANLRATSANLAASSARSAATARQISRETARTRAATNAARARASRTAQIAKQNAATREALKERMDVQGTDPPFDILPAAVLTQLSTDQAALQRLAQEEAFTAPVGETIFWEDGARTGTAMAESENVMGSFACRTFVQTVTIDAIEQRADALACRNPDGVWEVSLQRSDFAP